MHNTLNRDINKVPSFDDIIFNFRNKQYGAYNLRKKYPIVLLIACISGMIILSAAVIIPYIRATGKDYIKATDEKEVVFVAMEKLEPPDEEAIRIYSPPPLSREQFQQVKYIAPEVVDTVIQKEVGAQIMTADESLQNVRDGQGDENTVHSGEGYWVEGAPTEGEVFFIVEEMPSFQGKGVDGFRDYIARNLIYPQTAVDKGISGKVYIQFTVNSKGEVVDVAVVRGVDPVLDQEAVRVVKSSPRWEPGKQRSKRVNVQFTFPINFIL
jgi:protein TonB